MAPRFMPERVPRRARARFDARGPLTGGVERPVAHRKGEDERAAPLRGSGLPG